MIFKFSLIVLTLTPIVLCLNHKQLVEYAVKQYSRLNHTLRTGLDYPSEGIPTDDHWHVTPPVNGQWTAGFYPGTLWHLYNLTANEEWKKLAIKATDAMYKDQFRTDSHDIGFMIMCSYGNGYLFTKNETYAQAIKNAAHSLAERFDRKIKYKSI